jgi:hypothetical protein
MLSVSRIVPLAALEIWICAVRPALSQSSRYSHPRQVRSHRIVSGGGERVVAEPLAVC